MTEENKEIKPMSEDLRRQRRTLMAVSLILIFMKYSHLKITKFPVLGGSRAATGSMG